MPSQPTSNDIPEWPESAGFALRDKSDDKSPTYPPLSDDRFPPLGPQLQFGGVFSGQGKVVEKAESNDEPGGEK